MLVEVHGVGGQELGRDSGNGDAPADADPLR